MQPAIGDNGDIVIGGDGLEHGNSESDVVLIFRISLSKDEGVVEENNLPVDIFYYDQEGFGRAVDLFVPSEIGNDGKINP